MATRDELILRLRRLIDDVGHGYSQSAPGFLTDLTGQGLVTPSIDVWVDDQPAAVNLDLSPAAALTTGTAIATALQNAIRSVDPTLASYANVSVVYSRREGYSIRSGTFGSKSKVQFFPASVGDDAGFFLKLGTSFGGYETEAAFEYTDEELGDMIDSSLDLANHLTDNNWVYDTLPSSVCTIVVYGAWCTVVDTKIGRSAHYYSQKVASEEIEANVVFDNFLALGKWLKSRLDDMMDGVIGSSVECITATRFDRACGVYVADKAYYNRSNNPRILAVIQGETTDSVIVEYESILTPDDKSLFMAYGDSAGVWDQTALSEEDRTDIYREAVGLAADATLARTLRDTKSSLMKIEGLTPGNTYYFQIQVSDQNNNRYYSNEVEYTLPV